MNLNLKLIPNNSLENFYLMIGNFDGVHLGHQYLLKQGLELAKKNNVNLCICTFNPHPYVFFNCSQKTDHNYFLLEYKEKYSKLMGMGVKHILELTFDHYFKDIDGIKFLELVRQKFPQKLKGIILGYDSSFGKNKGISLTQTKDYCDSVNLSFYQVSSYMDEEELVSSSRIRELLRLGDIEKANRLLGKKFSIHGIVKSNKGLGKKEKTPTANLVFPESKFIPKLGVYLSYVTIENKNHPAISNVGINPTIDNYQQVHVETHILDHLDYHLSNKQIEVSFEKFVREEKKFSSKDDLFIQIKKDIEFAKTYFHLN